MKGFVGMGGGEHSSSAQPAGGGGSENNRLSGLQRTIRAFKAIVLCGIGCPILALEIMPPFHACAINSDAQPARPARTDLDFMVHNFPSLARCFNLCVDEADCNGWQMLSTVLCCYCLHPRILAFHLGDPAGSGPQYPGAHYYSTPFAWGGFHALEALFGEDACLTPTPPEQQTMG